MSYKDKLRQRLNWWSCSAPLRKGWTKRDQAVAKAALVRQLHAPAYRWQPGDSPW